MRLSSAVFRWVPYGALLVGSSPAVAQEKLRVPLPLDAAVRIQTVNGRSAFDLSPDGIWLAHSWMTEDSVQEGRLFTNSGVSYGEGHHRKQAALTNTKTGRAIKLGNPGNFSWAPVWSPDGNRVAYFSDEGGEAGIWVWEKSSGKARRFPNAIARSFLGFEIVRWSSDSRRILCKSLPEGMSVSQANSLLPQPEDAERFPKAGNVEPRVIVFQSGQKKPESPNLKASTPEVSRPPGPAFGDLAILDISTQRITRVARRIEPVWWSFSPDEKYIAYVTNSGPEPNSEQSLYEIAVYEVATGQTRKLAQGVHLTFGIELNWSPGSRALAYVAAAAGSKGAIAMLPVTGGASKPVCGNIPVLGGSALERPPLWDTAGQNLFVLAGDGRLWQCEVASGREHLVADIPGHRINHYTDEAL
ncbi:MAG TPA: hypothetical protein VKU19_24670 [Bryobacteraceae bacterium]|nr:hypothetical protein [Bryobacteraceae bacterium]